MTDADWLVRKAAIDAVSQAQDVPDERAWLRERAENDPDADVREAALNAACEKNHADPETLRWLIARAAADANDTVRAVAIRALASGWAVDPDVAPFLRRRAEVDQHRTGTSGRP